MNYLPVSKEAPSITYARKVYHSVVTNDRLLSDTRRIIPTLRACIIELFIPVFAIHLSLQVASEGY